MVSRGKRLLTARLKGGEIPTHTDPTSSINSENLQKTCGECHPGISKALATSKIHEAGGLQR